jgi:hypothetical protein
VIDIALDGWVNPISKQILKGMCCLLCNLCVHNFIFETYRAWTFVKLTSTTIAHKGMGGGVACCHVCCIGVVKD